MEKSRLITSVERLDNHAVITFDDGKCAVYSAALLYELLPQSTELPRTEDDDAGSDSLK